LNQKQIALLFDKSRVTITEHIKNVFSEAELDENMVCRNFRHTTQHRANQGKTQEKSVIYYNLDMIISVKRANWPKKAMCKKCTLQIPTSHQRIGAKEQKGLT